MLNNEGYGFAIMPEDDKIQDFRRFALRACQSLEEFVRDALSAELKIEPRECKIEFRQIPLLDEEGRTCKSAAALLAEFSGGAEEAARKAANAKSREPAGTWFLDALKNHAARLGVTGPTQ